MDKAVRAIISGRVQGVGFRAWTRREATARGLVGWVRNRQDGTVEAVFSGPEETVAGMVEACRHGPRMAKVADVAVGDWAGPSLDGFAELPTG